MLWSFSFPGDYPQNFPQPRCRSPPTLFSGDSQNQKTGGGKLFTYTYKDELGNEVTISISYEVHQIVEDEHLFERRIKDEYKKHITDLSDGRYEALPSMENVEESALTREVLHEVFDIVNGCTEKQRRRFLLHVVYGLPTSEIARLDGCAQRNVRLAIQRVMDKIMNNL